MRPRLRRVRRAPLPSGQPVQPREAIRHAQRLGHAQVRIRHLRQAPHTARAVHAAAGRRHVARDHVK